MEESYTPLKLGVKFNPPSLILQYKIMKATKIRTMPIRDVTKNTDCYKAAQKMKNRHEKHLGTIQTVRIEKFIRLLQITMSGKSLEEAVKEMEQEFTISYLEDMNKLTDEQLERRKELMDINFQKNQIKVGDPEFVYDKQVYKILSIFKMMQLANFLGFHFAFKLLSDFLLSCRLTLTTLKRWSQAGITPMSPMTFGDD